PSRHPAWRGDRQGTAAVLALCAAQHDADDLVPRRRACRPHRRVQRQAGQPDVRGRVYAWFLVVGPAGLLLTLVLTAVSGQTWSWPWVLAAEPAMVIGCAGLLVLAGARSVNAPAPDGGPSPARVLKTHLALVAIPVIVLFPAAALLIPGAI